VLGGVAKDGTPRTIPIGFTWNGAEIVMCTTKNAPKLTALRHNPAVVLTIDTEVHPPKILLIRGRAELDLVEGIPEEYLQINGTYTMTAEQRVEWEAEIRSLYDGMVRPHRRDPGLGETDRLRDHPPEPGRGTDPAARRTPARLSATTKRLTALGNHDPPGTPGMRNRRWPHAAQARNSRSLMRSRSAAWAAQGVTARSRSRKPAGFRVPRMCQVPGTPVADSGRRVSRWRLPRTP